MSVVWNSARRWRLSNWQVRLHWYCSRLVGLRVVPRFVRARSTVWTTQSVKIFAGNLMRCVLIVLWKLTFAIIRPFVWQLWGWPCHLPVWMRLRDGLGCLFSWLSICCLHSLSLVVQVSGWRVYDFVRENFIRMVAVFLLLLLAFASYLIRWAKVLLHRTLFVLFKVSFQGHAPMWWHMFVMLLCWIALVESVSGVLYLA